jgi:hypothetical protein
MLPHERKYRKQNLTGIQWFAIMNILAAGYVRRLLAIKYAQPGGTKA